MLTIRISTAAPSTTANERRGNGSIQFAAYRILGGILLLMPFPHEVRTGSNFCCWC
jgi:hypothetical protein